MQLDDEAAKSLRDELFSISEEIANEIETREGMTNEDAFFLGQIYQRLYALVWPKRAFWPEDGPSIEKRK